LSAARRLSEAEAAEVLARAQVIPASRGASPTKTSAVAAHDLAGQPSLLGPSDVNRVLLIFVTTSCDGCRELFGAADDPGAFGLEAHDELVFVARDHEDADALSVLVGGARALRSTAAFSAYRVSGAPFFALLDPAFSTVATEGVAWGVEPVRRAVVAARAGAPGLDVPRLDEELE
jgi:hypothetical protein